MDEASRWHARRDAGFTPSEQDEFLRWIAADPQHREAVRRVEEMWSKLDTLCLWEAAKARDPNADLLSPPRRASWPRKAALIGLAAALLVMVPFFFHHHREEMPANHGVRLVPGPERHFLEDGSTLFVGQGLRYRQEFTATERRLRLERGELHVEVAKDANRPFVVEVGSAVVRAVGTAFNVRRIEDSLDLIVTEGIVEVMRRDEAKQSDGPLRVDANKRVQLEFAKADATPNVTALTSEEVQRELAWHSVRLEFDSAPLAAVVAEFNLRGRQQLVVGDAEAARVRVSGTFRADQVEAFVRLLAVGFGIEAELTPKGDWILRRAKSEAPQK